MAKKDSLEKEPVESIEEEIQAAIDATEVVEDEVTEEQPEDVEGEPEPDEAEDDTDGGDEDSDEESDDQEEDSDERDEEQLDDEEVAELEETEDKLEAPEHWAAKDKEVFNGQTKEAQEWLLTRHKDMEGVMTRKTQELAFKTRQFDAVEDALSPYKHEFAAAGLDSAGAVRQLASWHNALKTGGKEAVLKLANIYQIDMSDEDQEYIDPTVASIKQELSETKNLIARQQQAAQQEQQAQLERVIDAFVNETDENGNATHPHFESLHDDIVRLFNAGMVKDLPDAYNKALALRPDLKPVERPQVSTKRNQIEKVKRAKKAATGIKSSGSVKTKRADISLEEEIAAHFK